MIMFLGGIMEVTAASIAWNSPFTIAGDADVSTNGSLVYACDVSGAAATVNTVLFAGSFSGNITVTGSAGYAGNSFVGGASAPWSGLSANYQTMLQGGYYATNNTAMSVMLSGLTVGHNYSVQVWVSDSRSGSSTNRTETVTSSSGNTVTLAYNSTQAQGGVGQYTIGTFTADATIQTFTLTGVLPSGNNSSQINAIQVREVGGNLNWGAATTIAGDADVSTNGNLVYACNDSGAAATVNTVPFAGSFSGYVTVSGSAGSVGNIFAGGASAPWSGLSANYQTVLQGGFYANNNTPLTVTLNYLSPGHNYSVQVWVNDSRSGGTTNRTETVTSSGGNSVTLAYNSTHAQGGVGQYAVGTFTAGGSTQNFTLTGVLPAGANSSQINAIQVRDVTPGLSQIPAFPGAEGYGALASGGRGGTVYHVTTLADSGTGSFRDAVSQPNRTVVFDVGGVINLASDVEVVDNITIAGQTAPGMGLAVTGAVVYLCHGFGGTTSYGHTNIIVRHMRFRRGYDQSGGDYSLALKPAHTVMLDHCSIEVGNWQTFSITYNTSTGEEPTDITVQNCIIGASVWHQLAALCWSPVNLTFHHNLFIDNGGRDPKLWGNMQVINDVVYNFRLGIYSDGAEQVDFIGNYQINGPGSNANSVNTGVNVNNTNSGIYYLAGNYWDNNLNGKLDGVPLTSGTGSFLVNTTATKICYPTIPVTVDSAVLAYHKTVCQAGCSLNRDPLDAELVAQAQSLGTRGPGTSLYMANTDPTNAWTGTAIPAWTITGGSAPADSDGDGMPDEWELATGSNYQVADNNVVATNGYTLLENYLNWLAAPHLKTYKNASADFDLVPLTVTFTNLSPAYAFWNLTNGTVTLVSNRWARFLPATNFTGLGSFTFSVTGTNGASMTNSVGALVSPIAPATSLVWRGDNVANAWNLYQTNDWFNGAALQPFNGDDNVTFDDTGSNSLPVNIVGQLSPNSLLVNSMKNYTFGGNGALVGSFTLTKTNSGTLTLAGTNSFSGGLVIAGGTVVVTNSSSAGGSGTVYLNGGTLNEASASFANPISCSGTNTWIISGGVNASPSSTLTGSGRLLLSPIASGQFTPVGDWSGFSGTIFFTGVNAQMRIYGGNTGSAGATFDLGTNTGKLYNRNGNLTVQLGALAGGAGTTLSGANAVVAPTTYMIGANSLDSTFAGKIVDDPANGISAVVKVGTGMLTLTGTNTYSGTTTISNGTLQVNGTLPTNSVTVAGGTLAGNGFINGPVTVNAGGTLSPGSPTGTLTISNNLTLAAGSVSSFGLGTNADRVVVKGNLVLGGTLNVTNLAGFAAGTNTLFTYTGTLSGSLAFGTMPAGYKFLLATNVAGQVNLLVAKPVIATARLVATNLIFSGTGGWAASNYYVLAATNLALPVSNWTRLATNPFGAGGGFTFTNALLATNRNRFYLLQMP